MITRIKAFWGHKDQPRQRLLDDPDLLRCLISSYKWEERRLGDRAEALWKRGLPIDGIEAQFVKTVKQREDFERRLKEFEEGVI